MKAIVTICLLMSIVLQLQAQQPFTIKGKISGAKEGAKVSLHMDSQDGNTMAEAVVKNEKFVLKGNITETALYLLSVEGAKQKLSIFLDPSIVTVSAHVDSLTKAVVKGSKSNDDFLHFRKQFDPYFTKLDGLGKQLQRPEMQSKQDSIYNLVRNLVAEINTTADAYIQKNSQSPVTPLLLYVVYSVFQQADVLDSNYARLSEAAQKSFFGRMVGDIVKENKIGAVGTDAIDFTQADTSGNPISLQSFRGKYVLVDFWASWCGPCRMENPNLVAAFNKFKEKNFTVLGVSLDRDRTKWLEAIAQDGLAWTHVSDLKFWSNEAARLYKITSIPQNLLIAPDGKIIGKNLRGEELQIRLEELFK